MDLLSIEINQLIMEFLPDLPTLYALIRASPVHNAIIRRCAQKKHHTLRKLVLKTINPHQLSLAILTCEAGDVTSIPSRKYDWKSAAGVGRCANCSHKYNYAHRRGKRYWDFYDRFSENYVPPSLQRRKQLTVHEFDKLNDLQFLKQLRRLTMLVSWFVDDYVSEARDCVREAAKRYQEANYGRITEVQGRAKEEKSGEEIYGKDVEYIGTMSLPETLSKDEYYRIQRAFFHFELYR